MEKILKYVYFHIISLKGKDGKKFKMEILVVVVELNQEYAGTAVAASHMLIQLADQGLHPVVINGNRRKQTQFPKIREYIKKGLIKEINIPSSRFPLYYHFSPQLPFKIRKLDPDLIIIHGYYNWYSDIALLLGIQKKKKIVFFPHGDLSPILSNQSPKSKIKRLYDLTFGWLYRQFVSIFISTSALETSEIQARGIQKNRISEIPHAMESIPTPNVNHVEEIRKRFNIRKHHIMYFGRLHWRKGIQFLIKALPIILRKNDNVTLTISGQDIGIRLKLEKLVKSLDIENHVVFTGFLSREELFSLIKNADVVVNPSNVECFGFTMAEAINLWKPVIQAYDGDTSNICLPLVKDRFNGYIVKFGDVEELAAKIISIIFNPDIRREFSNNSRSIAENFCTWTEVGQKYKLLIEKMMD